MEIELVVDVVEAPYPCTFVYDDADKAINPQWAVPAPVRSGHAICAGTLIFDLGTDDNIIDCWGYFPKEQWAAPRVAPIPIAAPGRVCVRASEPLVPGVSPRIEGSEGWSAYSIVGTPWVQFGETLQLESDSDVLVADGFICCLKKGRMVGVWLLIEK